MGSKEYFAEVAEQWDDMRQDFFSELVREQAYNVAAVKERELAADIGAGTGFITEGLLKKGLNVIAVDQSDEMLRQMKEKFSNYKNVDYRLGEDENLPINNNTVDYTMANMYLHHVKSPLIAIKEMARILKVGGKLIITDLNEHSYEFLRREQHDRWMGFKREDIVKWFSEAGLKNVIINCVGSNCCATSNSGKENADIGIFLAYGEK